MADISKKSPQELIDRLKFNDNITSDVNGFDSRKHLFDFGIDSDLSLNERKRIPKLKEEFHQNRSGLNIFLREGIDEAKNNKKMITNYDNYGKQLWTHFLRCLQKNNTIEEEEPTFVGLSQTIANLFCVEECNTTFFALKYNGVIYLSPYKSLEMEVNKEIKVTDHAYYHCKFLYLISDRNDSDINGVEMCLSVDRIDFNGNKIIVSNAIAVNDRDGSRVFFKCRPPYHDLPSEISEKRFRLLTNWSNSVVSDAKTLIIGRRDGPTLKEVDVMDVDSIPYECRGYWLEKTLCFSFVDQSLEFIKSCVTSELELYEFKIERSDKTLSCFRHESDNNSKYFLPKFYTN